MAKYFFDAGVPLLIGTDAPGFPGVMSGFGAHEEMRLLSELGIPAREVFAMATRNAGRFVDDTLRPEVGFGTLEPGKRADLILTEHNPLESLEHLKRPVAVMARGRFWSQTYLQNELNKLVVQQKQQSEDQTPAIDTEVLDFSPHH
jgi:imidazolonepropionase-like amidohydrolase